MPLFQWLNDEQLIQESIIKEMPERTRELFEQVAELDGGVPLLRLLDSNPNTLKSLDDLAYNLHQPESTVANTLHALVNLGLVRWVNVAGLGFFGLTTDWNGRETVRQICAWQDRWHARLARLGRMVDGACRPEISLGEVHSNASAAFVSKVPLNT